MKIISKNMTLRLVEEGDASFILSLRQNDVLKRYISETDPEIEIQIEWIKRYKERESQNIEYYFIITDNKYSTDVGTIRLYNFKKKRFSSGSWLIKRGTPFSFAVESYQVCLSFAFNELRFEECFFDVRKKNKKVVTFHEFFGAMREYEDELNYYYTLPKILFEKNRPKMLELYGIDSSFTKYTIVNEQNAHFADNIEGKEF